MVGGWRGRTCSVCALGGVSWFAFGSALSCSDITVRSEGEELDTEWEVNQLWSERERGSQGGRARQIDR